jgi:hypothetical protein
MSALAMHKSKQLTNFLHLISPATLLKLRYGRLAQICVEFMNSVAAGKPSDQHIQQSSHSAFCISLLQNSPAQPVHAAGHSVWAKGKALDHLHTWCSSKTPFGFVATYPWLHLCQGPLHRIHDERKTNVSE